jgi:hypothetical protein
MIAALYVESNGVYFGLPHIDPWDKNRDARLYNGPHPVIAHPPCQRYGQLGYINFLRHGGEHNRPGNDGGSFASALAAVNTWGGVLEHPAFSRAWEMYNLNRPKSGGWQKSGWGYVCEVYQSVYGHPAAKRTWLYYRGEKPPFELDWRYQEGTHTVGHERFQTKPVLWKSAASKTPVPFRDMLILLAMQSRQNIFTEIKINGVIG